MGRHYKYNKGIFGGRTLSETPQPPLNLAEIHTAAEELTEKSNLVAAINRLGKMLESQLNSIGTSLWSLQTEIEVLRSNQSLYYELILEDKDKHVIFINNKREPSC